MPNIDNYPNDLIRNDTIIFDSDRVYDKIPFRQHFDIH